MRSPHGRSRHDDGRVLPLSEIQALRDTVDDQWRSPVADAVAVRWGVPPGRARWWRSSASHVFVVPGTEDGGPARYVRFAPAALTGTASRLSAGAVRQDRLAGLGAAVAPVVRSAEGRVVEEAPTPHGLVLACVTHGVAGQEQDVGDLDDVAARTWGEALGTFHRAAGGLDDPVGPGADSPVGPVGAGNPVRSAPADTFARLARYAEHRADTDLADAAGRLADDAGRHAGAPVVVGHGDFELDNLRWERDPDEGRDRVTCFDLDESGPMSAASDVASAVRALVGADPTAPRRPALLASFLDGYGAVTGVGLEPGLLALHAAALAAEEVLDSVHVMDLPTPPGDRPDDADDPAPLADLADLLRGHYAGQRSLVLAAARSQAGSSPAHDRSRGISS